MGNEFLDAVREHADRMLAYGRDPEGEGALFASIVDPIGEAPVTSMVIPPPGIRQNDFSWAGNNTEHDVPFLEVLRALTDLTGDARYATAADGAIDAFARECPHPATGLFAWGTHAQWSFYSRRALPNNVLFDPFKFVETDYIIHEQYNFVPAWFWRALWASRPEAVTAFARGQDRHIVNHSTFEHNRHAALTENDWHTEPYDGPGKDFARTAGFIIHNALFAYAMSCDAWFLDWARRKLAYHTGRRRADGIIKGCIRTPQEDKVSHHLSLALCVHDGAQLLAEGSGEREEFAAIVSELLEAAVRVRPEQAYFDLDKPLTDGQLPNAWQWGYGGQLYRPHVMVSVWAQLHERTGEQCYADDILRVAEWHRRIPAPPEDAPALAYSFWANLTVPLEAHRITGDAIWLERAADIGRWALDRLAPNGLLHGVMNMEYHGVANQLWSVLNCVGARDAGRSFYFNSTGAPHLVRALLRLGLLLDGRADTLGTDQHMRIA